MKINKTTLKAIKLPESGQAFLWDDDLKGFGIRVSHGGAVAFVVQYRDANGKGKRRTLGRYGVIQIDAARDAARKILMQAADGIVQETGKITMDQLWDHYVDAGFPKPQGKGLKAPITAEKDAGRWRNHISGHLGARRVDLLKDADLLTMRNKLAKAGSPGTAEQCVALVKALLTYARDHELTKNTTGMNVKLSGSRKVSNPLSREALARLREVLREERNGPRMFSAYAVEIALLTGMRIGEVLSTRWAWVDLDAARIKLPSDKADRRNGRTVRLSTQAVSVMRSIPRMTGNKFVFCGKRGGRPLVNIAKPWASFKKAADIPDNTRIHDLRHTFGTQAATQGVPAMAIKELMGHRSIATTQRYVTLADDHLRDALEQVKL